VEHEVQEDLSAPPPHPLPQPTLPAPPRAPRRVAEPAAGRKGRKLLGTRFCDNEQNYVVFSPTKDATLES